MKPLPSIVVLIVSSFVYNLYLSTTSFFDPSFFDNSENLLFDRTTDSLALVELYKATSGENWDSTWIIERPIDTWFGITLDATNQRVSHINFDDNNLKGSLPAELGELSNLRVLRIQNDSLNGIIPSELGNLANLTVLKLNGNQLIDTVPIELRNLSNLTQLDLYNNQLSGNIPASIGDLAQLIFLRLYNNQLDGSIPLSIGTLDSLTHLRLDSNDLSGNIPITLGDLQKLDKLDLHNNKLNGIIPIELGNLLELTQLDLYNNNLEGEIPDTIGKLTKLKFFRTHNNQLTGCFPESFEQFCNINYNFSGNNGLAWQGDFSRFCNNENQMDAICDDNNSFTTDDQISACCFCKGIDTSNCRDRDSLALIALYNNTNGANWEDNTNWLSCEPIENWFGVQTNESGCVEQLRLDNNKLNGTIPAEMGNLKKLKKLRLSINNISGEIPTSFDSLLNLEELWLQNNSMTGSVPSELGNLPNIKQLFLSNNNLIGQIPSTLASLSNTIEKIHLHNNNLSGCFPKELISLCDLDINVDLDFRGNDSLPEGGDFLPFCDTGIGGCEATCRERDSLVLIDLYHSMRGENWTYSASTYDDALSEKTVPNAGSKWDFNTPINTWHGVGVDDTGCVHVLAVNDNGLVGKLFDLNLSKLESFSCSHNQISDSIPDFANLPNLKGFSCSNNSLSGSIPNFSKLPKLEGFNCSNNSMRGSIPDFDSIPNLIQFSCSNNLLGGTIPNFSNLPKLQGFSCANNSLSDSIPDFANSPGLIGFYCNANLLSGKIPDSLTENAWVNFEIDSNLFTFSHLLPVQEAIDNRVMENRTASHHRYKYYPQRPFFVDTTITIQVGQPLKIDLLIDDTVSTNEYEWFHNENSDTIIHGSNKRLFSTIQPKDAGIYTIRVTNKDPDINNLILHSRSINIIVEKEDCTITNHPDYQGLLALYHSTDSENWKNDYGWKEGATGDSCDPCDFNGGTWFGVFCENGRVVCLDLDDSNPDCNHTINGEGNGLSGSLVDLDLDNLKSLFLGYNNFESLINFEKPENLEVLRIEDSGIKGQLFDFNLPKLSLLSLEKNNLIEKIPNFSKSPNLSFLRLNENGFTGNLPDLGNKPIDFLRFGNNDLSGCIPDGYYNYCDKDVDFSGNPQLPWQGDFQQFCNDEAQRFAICDDGLPSTSSDRIQPDCECRGISAADCSTLTDGIIGHFYFSENTNDDASLLNHGIAANIEFITDRHGNPNSAVRFNGDSYIEVKNDPAYQIQNWTISFWFRRTDNPLDADLDILLAKGATGNRTFSFEVKHGIRQNNAFYAPWDYQMNITYIPDTGIPTDLENLHIDTLITSNEWHHAAATIEQNGDSLIKRNLYFDGIQVFTATDAGSLLTNDQSLFIGKILGVGSERFLNGDIDDLILYNRVLAAAEIQALFLQESPITTTIDTTICAGSTLFADAEEGSSYLWENSQTTSERIINESGTYSVSITAPNGCNTSITYHVSLNNHPDYEPLIAFYKSLDGPNWTDNTGWKEGEDGESCNPCNFKDNPWYGLKCENGRVTCIDLDGNTDCGSEAGEGNNLEGSIPSEIGNLSELTDLRLFRGQIAGPIPKEIGQLSNLKILSLLDLKLTETIPTEIGQLSNLLWLTLSKNQLEGSIPSSIGDLENLITLRLHYNNLSGTIPSELAKLKNLRRLYLHNNNLSGCFPQELLDEHCDLEFMETAGPEGQNFTLNPLLPFEGDFSKICAGEEQIGALCNDGNQKTAIDKINIDCVCMGVDTTTCRYRDSLILVQLYNSTNGPNWTNTWDLNTPMDTWFGVSLKQDSCITSLDLDGIADSSHNYPFDMPPPGNNLQGTLPNELCQLNHLDTLNLGYNDLIGTIPSCIDQLSTMRYFLLPNNNLNGNIPSNIGELTNLEFIWLSNNILDGPIPSSIGDLNNLRFLRLDSNQLNSAIPPELGKLSMKLENLHLFKNKLEGSIPSELGQLMMLKELLLHDNELTGILPSELGNLDSLKILLLRNNMLSGCFPSSFEKFCGIINSVETDLSTGTSKGYDFTENGSLSWGGDFSKFCAGEPPPELEEFISVDICAGESYQFGDSSLSDSGQYERKLITQNGCDSIVHLTLTIHPSYNINIDTTICNNEPIPSTLALTTQAGCDSIINYTITMLELIAEAGDDQTVCTPETTLEAISPSQGMGTWTTDGDAIILDPTSPTTMVSELEEGENWFVWSVYSEKCDEISMDSINVFNEGVSFIVNNDNKKGGKEKRIQINVIENDSLSGDWDISVLFLPQKGTLIDIQKGIFEYMPDNDLVEIDSFQYRICLVNCQDQCNVGKVKIEFESFEPNFSATPTITPNGDEFNQKLIFENLTVDRFPESKIIIFGRYSNVIYSTRPYLNDWEGTYNGETLPDGTYFFILSPSLESKKIKGYITILTE